MIIGHIEHDVRIGEYLLFILHRADLYNLKVNLVGETEPLLEKVSTEVEKHIAVKRIVEEKIHAFDLDQLEAIVRKLAHQEFRSIEVLGAVIGLIVGLVQSLLLLLAQIG